MAAAGELPPCVDRARVLDAQVTSTGVGIAIVGRRWMQPCVAVKLAFSSTAAAGLEREGRALAALHEDVRLEGWRSLLPQRLASGSFAAWRYAVDTAIPHAPALTVAGDETALAAVQVAAAEAIGILHRRTAAVVTVGDALVEQWVTRPAAVLAEQGDRAGAVRAVSDRLADTLHGRTLSASWVHGDFWPGNLLVRESGGLGGIVDWDAAAPHEPVLHDVLHLLLYTRRLTRRADLGQIVLEQLRAPAWTPHEQRVLRAHGGDPSGGLPEREALLLYWLRHAAVHTRQQVRARSPRYRVWRRRNLDRVLEAL